MNLKIFCLESFNYDRLKNWTFMIALKKFIRDIELTQIYSNYYLHLVDTNGKIIGYVPYKLNSMSTNYDKLVDNISERVIIIYIFWINNEGKVLSNHNFNIFIATKVFDEIDYNPVPNNFGHTN